MIYTVTLNPSLDYIVSVEDFRLGRTNRTESELMLPGGKGINVSIVLRGLGFESVALGFLAGFTGRELVSRLEEFGVKNDFVWVGEGLTRINVKLKNIEGTEINGQGPYIGKEEFYRLMGQLDQLVQGDVLFLSGSIPNSLPEDIYRQMIERLDGRGILTVVDAAGRMLRNVVYAHPFLVKPNHYELGELFGVSVDTREQAAVYARKLQEKGARNVLVSMAGEGAVLVTEDGQFFEAPAPKGKLVNSVGAGDSMLAGFMAGWLEKKDFGHAFLMGLAAGSASAFSENLATKKEIMYLLDVLGNAEK